MNMHHIAKTLFVGAAIAGIGMSSGRAELQLEENSKECARVTFRYHVDECYNKLRECLPSDLNLYIRNMAWDLTDYESDTTYEAWKKEDVQTLLDSLFGEGGYLSRFEDAEDYLKASNGDPRKNLKEFLEAEFSFRAVEGKKLNLMRFLKKVAFRFNPIGFDTGNYYGYFADKYRNALVENGMIEESKETGCYLPKWSFIFDDDFINGITFLITEAARQQINKK